MTRFEKYECISCHEESKDPIKEDWFIMDYTHELVCNLCGISICKLTKEYLN